MAASLTQDRPVLLSHEILKQPRIVTAIVITASTSSTTLGYRVKLTPPPRSHAGSSGARSSINPEVSIPVKVSCSSERGRNHADINGCVVTVERRELTTLDKRTKHCKHKLGVTSILKLRVVVIGRGSHAYPDCDMAKRLAHLFKISREQQPPLKRERDSAASEPELSGSDINREWSLDTPRIFDILAPVDNILIAGCGGGYDILSGLPLFFYLTGRGKKVTLANLSFTTLCNTGAQKFSDGCYSVLCSLQPSFKLRTDYFPELYLAQWLKQEHGMDTTVYAFDREVGVKPLSQAYQKIVKKYDIGAVVLVDGGTDSLMLGNEKHMGTPTEDHCSMAAVNSCSVPIKLLACLGFGVDAFHGVSHGLFLENVAEMERAGGYLGCFSVSSQSREGRLYMEGYRAVSAHMQPSIVCSSITDAMSGHFGNHHSTGRTGNTQLFINPLMSIYWTFELPVVVSHIPYAKQLLSTNKMDEVTTVIMKHNGEVASKGEIRNSLPLPM